MDTTNAAPAPGDDTKHVPHFRRYQREEPSWWRLTPWILLGAFDLALWGYIIHELMR